ncbi:MAG TPA: molybdopterin cofactor-binding domain-containing protein, partial [Thermoanaerobaculia bacterium]
MADRTDYTWPEARDRRLIGKRISRLDGPAKVTGAAKYTYDLKRPGMLYAKVVRCPYGHAKVAKLDFAAALRMPGVKVARAIQPVGTEVQWGGDEVAVVVATSEGAAEDAARAVVALFEELPHWVRHDDADAAPKTNPGEEQKVGDPDGALAAAAVKIKGRYGLPFAAHNCMEAHGQICEWQGSELTAWCSTQAVSGLVQQLAEGVGVPASNVRILTDYMGGGYGSKFSIDRWGVECAKLAKEAGAPVKLMLERRPELAVA